MNLQTLLSQRVTEALTREFQSDLPAMVARTQDAQFGDYQSNVAMALAKSQGAKPRDVAERLVAAIDVKDLVSEVTIAGPGFINFRLSPEFLGSFAALAAKDARGGADPVDPPKTIVVEYSSPNVAKRLHVGHLRSTILGDAMARLLEFQGHKTIRDNHVGDWGTQFGLLMVAFRRWADEAALKADPIGHLESLYQQGSAAAKADPALANEARAELAKLQQGDAENTALWKRFVEISYEDVNGIYDLLDVRFDHWYGESFYNPYLAELVQRLESTGLAREDAGALLVFFPDQPELEKTPFIVRKQDGAYLYATTDIATIEYREREWHPDRVLYFVDRRQALHFTQLFVTVSRMGYDSSKLEHISFGSIMNAEGKPLKTRDGATPSLRALLEEGVEAAAKLVAESRPDMSPERRAEVARAVGIGAIKYADLSQNRNTDYKFDLNKMISFEGNTGPYLQYTLARINSIFRKLEGAGFTPPATIQLSHPEEINLARTLTRFDEMLDRTAETCMPSVLCEYLYALAKAYSAFYTHCPILKAEGDLRITRLTLCRAVQHQLHAGLTCLGIVALEEM